MSEKMLKYLSGTLLAVVIANSVVLAVYVSGYPILALYLSPVVGLTVGGVIGWCMTHTAKGSNQ